MVITIICAVLIFGLIIFVHELGHFAAAKLTGVRVNEFAMGMGPVILKTKKGDTQYALRAFPIGGFVRMEGEDEESDQAGSFNNKPGLAKAFILFAGSAMNYLLAVVLIAVMILSSGFATNTISEVSEGLPAAAAGIQKGDVVVNIDGNEVNSWEDILKYVKGGSGEQISFTVLRETVPGTWQEVKLTSEVAKEEDTGRRIVGIQPAIEKDFFRSIKMSFVSTFEIMKQMVEYLGTLVTGHGSVNDLAGPVGITKMVGDTVEMGVMYVINFTAIISLNLAIVNMLPLPALDGGRLVFLAIEGIIGRRISEEVAGRIHFAGFVLLMALMLVITIKDINVFILK